MTIEARTAVEALRKIARLFDGRNPGDWRGDALSLAICASVGVEDPSGLVSVLYGPDFDRARIAKLAAVVVEVAEKERDEECFWSCPATSVLDSAGIDLGMTVIAVADRLGLKARVIPLALAGGFLLSSPIVASTMERSLMEVVMVASADSCRFVWVRGSRLGRHKAIH